MSQPMEAAQIFGPTFSLLSTDIKLEVFDFIRSTVDQGNARLVSQEWNHLIKPQMWRSLTRSLRGISTKDFETLVDEKNGCLQNIRKFIVGGRHVDLAYNVRFSTLLHLICDKQLDEFKSAKETPISTTQLLYLLSHQPNLRRFSARLNFSDVSIENRPSWVSSQTRLVTASLHSLRCLRVYVRDRPSESNPDGATQEFEVACTRLIISSASLLEDLQICGLGRTRVDRIPVTILFKRLTTVTHVSWTLRRLLFSDMNFSNLGSELADLINVSTLYSLKFEYCTRIGPFLLALAATFRQSTGLKILTVRTDNNDMASRKYYTSPPLAALLRSFEGLEELELDLPVPGPIAEKESFSPHRDSLKGLLVRFEMMICAHSYWITRIAQILGQCPNVQQFAYLPQVPNLGKVEECQVPCSVPTVSRGVLDSIVASPNIRVLRLLYSPGLTDAERALREEPEWAEKAARIAHGFATQVLRYIALRGSNVSLLALSPVSRWKQDRCDSNGHYYPHYYYRRETSAVCDNGVITNAVPIRDCLVEFPDATILTMF